MMNSVHELIFVTKKLLPICIIISHVVYVARRC